MIFQKRVKLKRKMKLPLSIFLFGIALNLQAQITLVDFGSDESGNVFGLDGWNTLIKSPNVNYSSLGPAGLLPKAGIEEYDDYQGVRGDAREFKVGERIVVTWFNTSATETYTMTARISFEDSNAPDEDGSEGHWFTMRSFEDYRNGYVEIPPGESRRTVFNITDKGVHKTNGQHSVVNVNLHIQWYETEPKQYILCDKIELFDDADVSPPQAPANLTVVSTTDSKVSLSWDVPADNVGAVEYLIYNGGQVEGYSRTNSYTAVFLEPQTTCTFSVTALDAAGNESLHSEAVTATTKKFANPVLFNPKGFVYKGAIKTPEIFSYGGEALTYNPNGDGGENGAGALDGYPGSLFLSDLNNQENGFVGEVGIPQPVISNTHNLDELNEVNVLQTPVNIRPANINSWDYVDIWRNGLEYVESENRLYGSWTLHYTVSGEKRATISCCSPNDLSSTEKYGAWYVGKAGQPPIEAQTSDYIFEIPQIWADAELNGRSIVTGRFRDGGLSGLGPTLYAFAKVGETPPAENYELPITTLLEYGSVEGTDNYNYPNSIDDYNHADAWRAAEWIEGNGKSAVMFIGNKAHGNNWYGWQGEKMRLEWVEADLPFPEFYNTDPDGKGWRAESYLPMAVFYNPEDLAKVAKGEMQPFEPQPYAALRFDRNIFYGEKAEISSACYDAKHKRLFVTEFNAPNDGWLIIHVFDYDSTVVKVEEKDNVFPKGFRLYQNYPNPFPAVSGTSVPTTTIKYSIPAVGTAHELSLQTRLIVYDILGRKVATLVNKAQKPGDYSVKFNASRLPAGIYFYRLQAGNFSASKKMVILK